ncbi:hypothetical protein Fcan01_22489 [Folsomia candida]|uniref:FHA domain-containing protein n=1 Tax=Folsomia candida TaxID=158441 RepID=A0A226DCQ5_FOLCA|nr:hypothetical protein Fcan01_22489 [Folsomia candida]
MVRTRRAGSKSGVEDGDVDWAKFLYDDGDQLVTEEVSVIPKNIVAERRKRLEGLLSKRGDELETCVDDSDGGGDGDTKSSRTISPSVDKRHAVLCFDPNADSFSLKDLNTTNGTFLNNRRISSDRPETLNNMDLLRFGFDILFHTTPT